MKKTIYAIGDIHGCLDELLEILTQIENDHVSSNGVNKPRLITWIDMTYQRKRTGGARPPEKRPQFVLDAIKEARTLVESDSTLRLRVDYTLSSVIAFSAEWQERSFVGTHRLAYLQVKKTEAGNHVVVFAKKILEEGVELPNKEYDRASRSRIASDIVQYLRYGEIPK